MNFSKLSPKNWFRREEPKAPPSPPQATGQPKYKVGQRCIVLCSPGREGLIGHEVVLEEVFSHYFRLSGAGAGWTWITDHSDVFPGFDGIKRRRGFLEPWLLPIDDETLNEELRQEVIDDFGTKKVQFSDLLKKLDQAIDELQEQVKRDQAI